MSTKHTSTLLSRQQRAIVCADTKIDRLIVDRACDAFDALITRGDVAAYKVHMGTAVAQMGYGRPVRPQDRPTAVDVCKTFLIRAYSDQEKISFSMAATKIKQMLAAGGGA